MTECQKTNSEIWTRTSRRNHQQNHSLHHKQSPVQHPPFVLSAALTLNPQCSHPISLRIIADWESCLCASISMIMLILNRNHWLCPLLETKEYVLCPFTDSIFNDLVILSISVSTVTSSFSASLYDLLSGFYCRWWCHEFNDFLLEIHRFLECISSRSGSESLWIWSTSLFFHSLSSDVIIFEPYIQPKWILVEKHRFHPQHAMAVPIIIWLQDHRSALWI